ncbi:MAG: hypothetical protein M1813_002979 [Trichoglossum hirsutum]|nr:MAG: hypothetical protein M1813_002979 [Trichoglossum hirsutum]
MVITARVGPIGSSRLPKCLRFSQQGRIPLRFHVETDLITVLLAINEGEVESDEKVGALDDYHTSVILKLRAAVPSIQFRPFLAEDPVDIRSGVKIVPVSCSIEIVLYGVRADIDRVGSIFTDARIHLQEPDYIEPHVVYHNPHVLWWEDDFGTPRFKLWGPVDDEEEAKAIVTAAEPLPPALETERHDPRIRTTLYG